MAGYIETSKNNEWETPPELFTRLNEVFKFTLDGACNKENCLCDYGIIDTPTNLEVIYNRHSKTEDKSLEKLENTIFKSIYYNPPYNDITKWIHTAYHWYKKKSEVVMLIPASTELKVWHDIVWPESTHLMFLKGRVKFWFNKKPALSSSPKGSAIVCFAKPEYDISSLSDLGYIIKNGGRKIR